MVLVLTLVLFSVALLNKLILTINLSNFKIFIPRSRCQEIPIGAQNCMHGASIVNILNDLREVIVICIGDVVVIS